MEFRKRLTDDIIGDINEMIIDYNTSDDDPPTEDSGGNGESDDTPTENKDTLILDATCALQQIAFPQDINLLNEAREKLESLIDDICFRFHYYKPHMYRQNARKDYLSHAKCRKRTAKKIRKAIKKQLRYVNCDLGYIDLLLAQDDVYLKPKQMERLNVIRELVEQ